MPQRTYHSPHLKVVSAQEESYPSPPVVAMIIPAGDATAFGRLFQQLPLSMGIAYLIMEYSGVSGVRVSGEPAENLPAMLERTTLLPLRIPVQDTMLEKDCIYLLPPDRAVGLVKGRLIFQGLAATDAKDYFPDLLLASVAAGTSGRCAVFVLPDMASRVLPGLRVVRDEGGITIVLDEADPFVSPHPVHQCPLVDLYLTVSELGSKLAELATYFRGAGKENGDHFCAPADWSSLLRLLLDRGGIDYSRYPRAVIVRHLHRRMAIVGMSGTGLYTAFIAAEEEELHRLNEDLQSTVSGFFLEPDLEIALVGSVLPRWLDTGPHPAPLRVWLPHCSGGHQAYSIAMAIVEGLEAAGAKYSLQLFVTCFNKNSIEQARKGIYDKEEIAYVSRSRKRKFFTRKENHWQVIKSIRDKCIFATHDLLKDPPFSHIDIVIESGSLIGFQSDTCARAFRLFHYALAPDGFLIAHMARSHEVPGDLYSPTD